jgi:hypothetical protein
MFMDRKRIAGDFGFQKGTGSATACGECWKMQRAGGDRAEKDQDVDAGGTDADGAYSLFWQSVRVDG